MTEVARPRHSIRFHGRSYHAMVLAPEPPVANWLAELDTWLERSPGFFFGRPVVLDVAVLQPRQAGPRGGFAKPRRAQHQGDGHRRRRTILARFRDAATAFERAAGQRLPGDNPPGAAEAPAPAPFSDPAPDAAAPLSHAPSPPGDASSAPAVATTPQQPNSLLMDSSIRSGQCIVHPEGDVIVVGSVASGAEVIAGGSIHIYGTLRGRAIAGSRDARARIFCRKLEAELLSIDGLYMVADDMPAHLRGQPIQVWLDGDLMMMAQD